MGASSAAGAHGPDAAGALSSVTHGEKRLVPVGSFADVGGGLRVHYHELGQGPVVLFLHGSGPGASGYSNFRRNTPFLAERGFRVLVPDTLGFGHSSKPDDVDYTLDFLRSALERFLKTCGVTECAVVGNSHGGALAISLALHRPELVTKLILMAPGGLEMRETYVQMRGIRSMFKAVTAPEGITRESLRKVLGLQLHDPALLTDDIVDERLEIAVTQPKRVLTSLQVPELAPELPKLGCPVFGLWGVNDQFCPVSGASKIAELCPDARVLLVGRCGHWVMVEHPALFNRQAYDFLREG